MNTLTAPDEVRWFDKTGTCKECLNPAIVLPFWMEKHMNTLRAMKGSDVVPTDGSECDAFSADATP